MPHVRLIRAVGALTVGTVVLGASAVASAEDADPLAPLKAHFQRDPANAFPAAWEQFKVLQAKGDLEGMMDVMDVVEVVQQASHWCLYFHVLEDMLEEAVRLLVHLVAEAEREPDPGK